MIRHRQSGLQHIVTPLTEKAALFLNSFVGREIVMSEKEWQSTQLEMPAHRVWIMGESSLPCYHTQRAYRIGLDGARMTTPAINAHTPGPWRFAQSKGGAWFVYPATEEAHPITPNIKISKRATREAIATARLISKAPEMLAALRYILDCATLMGQEFDPALDQAFAHGQSIVDHLAEPLPVLREKGGAE